MAKIAEVIPNEVNFIDEGYSNPSRHRRRTFENSTVIGPPGLNRRAPGDSSPSGTSPNGSSSDESNVGSDSGVEPAGTQRIDTDSNGQLGQVSLWRWETDTTQYVYWPQAGQGVTIYVIDTGANPKSDVSTSLSHIDDRAKFKSAIYWPARKSRVDLRGTGLGCGPSIHRRRNPERQ